MRYSVKFDNFTWVEIKNPSQEDGQWLQEHFKLHPLVLKDLLPPLDYPKIENFGDYIFLTIFYPFFDKQNFMTVPWELDIVVGKDFIITSHYQDLVPLKAIFDKCNLYEESRKECQSSSFMLYRVLKEMTLACFPKINHIKKNIEAVEDLIYQGHYQKAVAQISLVRRDIIGFQRVVEPQSAVLKSLVKENGAFFEEDLMFYMHSAVNLHDQARGLLETHDRTLASLNSTNQSLLNDRTNEIIKLLTIFSVIVFPLTLFSSLFSMNTSFLPIVGAPYDFWIILGIMTMGVFFMLYYFKSKKWL